MGQGGFGKVFLVKKKKGDADDTTLYAMKVLEKTKIDTEESAIELMTE
jgi:hypothetical protein